MLKTGIILICFVMASQASANAIDCSINIAEANGTVEISAHAMGVTGVSGDYRMTTSVESDGNQSVSAQGGRFVIENAENPTLLTRLIVGKSPSQWIVVQLSVSTASETVACNRTLE